MKKMFSIIIPALNEEKYLPKLLSDLTKQSFQDFAVIVVDGNSDDATVKQCLRYKKRLPSLEIIPSKIRNVSYQRNLGAGKANGEWIIFMDADNRLPYYFLDGVKYRILKGKPDCFTTYCAPDSKKPSDGAIAKLMNLALEIIWQMDAPTAQGSMIGVRRDVFRKYGEFDTTVSFAEDNEYIKRIYKKGAHFLIFRDPRYVFSLRHYRREGKLKYMGRTASLHLKNLAGLKINQLSEYPMGGTIKQKKNVNGLAVFYRSMKVALRKPKILKKIKRYLNYSEGDY